MIFGLSFPEFIFYCAAAACMIVGFIILIRKVDFERKIDLLAGCVFLLFLGAGFVYAGQQVHFNDIVLNQLSSTKDTLNQSKVEIEELFEKKTELEIEIKEKESIYKSEVLALKKAKAQLAEQAETINQKLTSAHEVKKQLLDKNTELNKQIAVVKDNFKSLNTHAKVLFTNIANTYAEESMDDKEKLKNISFALGKLGKVFLTIPWPQKPSKKNEPAPKPPSSKPSSSITPKPPATDLYKSPTEGLILLFRNNKKL